MRHQKSIKNLDRNHAARAALLRTQAISLIMHGHMRTTKAKAQSTRPLVERLITRAKRNTESSRRYLLACLDNVPAVNHLITVVAPLMKDRNGGYTRMTKLGFRKGDGAELVQIDFVK